MVGISSETIQYKPHANEVPSLKWCEKRKNTCQNRFLYLAKVSFKNKRHFQTKVERIYY